MSRKLRLGIVGCGGISTYIFRECKGLECIEPIAAYDKNPEAQTRFVSEFGLQGVDSLEALLGLKTIDAVVLTTPQFIRPDQVIQAAQAGKAVFSEKPLALSVSKAWEVIHACEKAGVQLMVGQVLRYFGGFSRVATRIRAGMYGNPLAITLNRFGGPFPPSYHDKWRVEKKTSGGLLFEVHVHEFDFSRYVCGDPESVFALSRRVGVDPNSDYEDLIMGVIEFQNGAYGQCHFSHISPRGDCTITVWLEKGVVSAGFGGATQKLWDQEEEEIKPEFEEEPPYRKEIRLFAESVLSDIPVPIPGKEGLWAVAMAEAFEVSSQTHTKVSVPAIAGIS